MLSFISASLFEGKSPPEHAVFTLGVLGGTPLRDYSRRGIAINSGAEAAAFSQAGHGVDVTGGAWRKKVRCGEFYLLEL